MKLTHLTRRALLAAILTAALTGPAFAQAAAQGSAALLDLNTAAEKEVASLPHMTPALAKELIAKRPFASIRTVGIFAKL